MPGLPLVARETTFSRSRTPDGMCRQNFINNLSPEEALAAEESLSVYCKPVELYNILLRRSSYNPLFLQRCLSYKIQARNRHRIQISVSVSARIKDELHPYNLSLYILLAKPLSETSQSEDTAVYRLSRVCKLGLGTVNKPEASFVVPEFRKLLADARCRNLSIILLGKGKDSCEQPATSDGTDKTGFPEKLEGKCIWGKLLLRSVFSSPEMNGNFNLGRTIEFPSLVDMHSCTLEATSLEVNNLLCFRSSHFSGTEGVPKQVKLSISAHEVGSRERSPYESYFCGDIPPNIMRLRAGNVVFNYRYYNNSLRKTEVTEDFACPFCLVKCASFKGLRYHLTSSHDFFNFEFWITEEYQAVNVSVKTDLWRTESLSGYIDPRMQTFNYWSGRSLRRGAKVYGSSARSVLPLTVMSEIPEVFPDVFITNQVGEILETTNADPMARNDGCPSVAPGLNSEFHGSENPSEEQVEPSAVCASSAQASVDECGQQISGSNIFSGSVMPQLSKTRKGPVDRGDPKNRTLLQKRQFFHSHRAQPMALEQVLSDQDSEDEVDDDIADLEDRRMLDDFVDVTKDEKRIMHLWNSFVRRQRVLADGHIPWACEAFTKLHGRDFVKEPSLLWCWRLFMIKLWNHSLLDGRTMNSCNVVLEQFQNAGSDSGPI
ncbi:VEFS-Box of polycomb protein [Wolffia australiana]